MGIVAVCCLGIYVENRADRLGQVYVVELQSGGGIDCLRRGAIGIGARI